MNEQELGSWNFAFEINNMDNKEDFMKAGCFECIFLAQDAIVNPGTYAIKLILTKLDNNFSNNND